MIIEFFGVPGSGKTTLMRKLLEAMPDSREARAATRREIARGAIDFSIRHPVSFLIWSIQFCMHARGLFRYKLALLLRSMAARSHAERSDGVVFLDEGMVQRLLSIFDTPLSEQKVRFLLHHTPMPDAVVVLSGGGFSRFTEAPNRFNSPRVQQGKERFEEWKRVIQTNAGIVRAFLPRHTEVVEDARGVPLKELEASLRKKLQTAMLQ